MHWIKHLPSQVLYTCIGVDSMLPLLLCPYYGQILLPSPDSMPVLPTLLPDYC